MTIAKPTPHHLNYLKQQGISQKTIATVYGVSERMVRYWKRDDSKPNKKAGRKEKLNQKYLSYLRLCINSSRTKTQKEVAQFFSKLMGKKVSQPTICRAIKKIKTTYKKMTYQASEQFKYKNKEKIKQFINETIPSLLQSEANIFFLDECSFRLNLAPRRGYSHRGSPVVYQRLGNKGKHYTLILLVQITNGEKVIHSKLIEGGVNSEIFHNFLSEFNPPNNGRKNVLIMDNLSAHKAKQSCIDLGLTPIKELLKNKNIEPIYLPSYTPELNPVEKFFNIIRQYIETKQPREKEELVSFIQEKLEFFQEEDTTKYLKNSIKECLMKNSDIDNAEPNDLAFRDGKCVFTFKDHDWEGNWWKIKGKQYTYYIPPAAYKRGNWFWIE